MREDWRAIIERNVALYRLLPAELKPKLECYAQILLNEKNFEGAGGLTLTDEMRVTVAAEAAILILGRPKPTFFPKAISVVIYPGAYVVHESRRDGFIETEDDSVRLGESWMHGVVVLSWEEVKRHAVTLGTGHNVVLHEFAHQLDQEAGASTGTPILSNRAQYAEWGRILGAVFDELRDKARHHQGDVLDEYGAVNPAEFFAVATETFFTNPHMMRRAHASLYEELKGYYLLDPVSWVKP